MFKFFDIQDVVDSAPAFVGNLLFYDVTASEKENFFGTIYHTKLEGNLRCQVHGQLQLIRKIQILNFIW